MNSVQWQDTKSSTNKNQLCFYKLISKYLKKIVRKTISFTVTSKIIKYLGTNLAKEVGDFHAENYKALMKETLKTQTMKKHHMFIDWKAYYFKVSTLSKVIKDSVKSLSKSHCHYLQK